MRDLRGKVVAVVGASSGMGWATALRFVRAGTALALGARSAEKLDALVVEAQAEQAKVDSGATAEQPPVAARPVDVRSETEVRAWFAWVKETFSRLDVLVYAAGTNAPNRAVGAVDAATWQAIVETNLTGAFYATDAALPLLQEAGDGLIVYISSVSAKRADGSGIAYQASKRGLDGLAHGMMGELKASGLRATVVYPGVTDTPLLEKRPVRPTAEQLAKALKAEDVAEVCHFVAAMPAHTYIPEIILGSSLLKEPTAPVY